MFRSGTTLLPRLLQVHPEIVSASDPMRPLINSFRYDVAGQDYQRQKARFSPLDDYFVHYTDVLDKVLSADLHTLIGCESRHLTAVVQERAHSFSGLYAQALDTSIQHKNYYDIVAYCFETIIQAYGENKHSSILAFKEVWSNEFFPALKKSFPQAKCLLILRDPRAIVASKKATGEPYPIAFMGRQWRKLACLADFLREMFPNDVLLLKYEDLVLSPESSIGMLCEFLGVDFSADLLDTSLYLDGWKQPWHRNSSFKIDPDKKINSESTHKWKDLLDPKEIKTLELFVYDWMTRFGYQTENSLDVLLDLQFADYWTYTQNEVPEWLRALSFDHDPRSIKEAITLEKLRLQVRNHIPIGLSKTLTLPWWHT